MADQLELHVTCRVLDDGTAEVHAEIELVIGEEHRPGDKLTLDGSALLTGPDWEALLKRAEAQNRVAYLKDATIQSVRPTTLLKVREDDQIELSVRAEIGQNVTLHEGERLTLTDILSPEQWDQLGEIVASERSSHA